MRRFVSSISEKALGSDLIRGVRPEQQLVKVCHAVQNLTEGVDSNRPFLFGVKLL